MKKAEVKFENITKKFNETTAVDNVSCNFEAGTLTTLLVHLDVEKPHH